MQIDRGNMKSKLLRRSFAVFGILSLCMNLNSCGSDPEFEAQVKQSWEDAFIRAQADPCSIAGDSIRADASRDPRFEAWARANPGTNCPPYSGKGGSAECGGNDEDGNFIHQSCEDAIAAIVGEG